MKPMAAIDRAGRDAERLSGQGAERIVGRRIENADLPQPGDTGGLAKISARHHVLLSREYECFRVLSAYSKGRIIEDIKKC